MHGELHATFSELQVTLFSYKTLTAALSHPISFSLPKILIEVTSTLSLMQRSDSSFLYSLLLCVREKEERERQIGAVRVIREEREVLRHCVTVREGEGRERCNA